MNLDLARSTVLSSAAADYDPTRGYSESEFTSAVDFILAAELGDEKPWFTTPEWMLKVVRFVRDGEPLVEVDQEWEDFLTDLYAADLEDEQDDDHALTEPCSVHRSWTCTARCERRHAGAGLPPAELYVPTTWTEIYGSPAISAVPAGPRRHHRQQEHP